MAIYNKLTEPDYKDFENQPLTLTKSRRINGIHYLAGRAPEGRETCEVMFVTSAVEEEEASAETRSSYGFKITQAPEYLKGSCGIIKELALQEGLDMDRECYYTAVCKWLLPREKRSRPPAAALKWGQPILEDEIRRVKPKIIVCLGKPAFDVVSDVKLSFKDAHGGWFYSATYEAHVYVMHTPYSLVNKPELYEGFRVDFAEIKRKLDILNGNSVDDLPIRYEVLDSLPKLEAWVDRMLVEKYRLFSADCEWHGRTYYDMDLRMIQFAYTQTDAVVVEFRDENNEWSFDLGDDFRDDESADDRTNKMARYKAVGAVLQRVMNLPETRFIGHHFSADSPPMNYWLGINTYEKCVFDTEFAQQCVDETSELGLERGIAMKYTTLGLYDVELTLWKKSHKALCNGGYGYIPRELIIPYAVKDVIVPMRAYPIIQRQLDGQGLREYYDKIFNPFVTDVFTEFTMCGLPMNRSVMEDMRELFQYAKTRLEAQLKREIGARAISQLYQKWLDLSEAQPMKHLLDAITKGNTDDAMRSVAEHLPLADIAKWRIYFDHLFHAPNFNIRSSDDMRRWLFGVEGLTPVKSTNKKAQGMPSMAWEKVLDLPEDKQRMFTPAVDKQTVQILSEKLPTLQFLLDLNVVGNICKGFLKEPDVYVDDFTGEEVVEEQGLFQWLTSDDRVCGMFSTTPTSRPRSWKPNTLNWPSYVQERINRAIAHVLFDDYESGVLPEGLYRWIQPAFGEGVARQEMTKWITGKIPAVRSFVEAPEGWCLVESDYKTAEMVGLATISGDKAMLSLLHDPDPEWACLKKDNPYGVPYVRVKYEAADRNGIPASKQNPAYVMQAWKDGKHFGAVDPAWLLRDDSGNVIHRGYDIHWSIAERVYERPREEMEEKVHRSAGKVINFSSAYGASPSALERKIEADTGVKPDEGVGQKGLDAIKDRQPRATEFLEEMGELPTGKGYYRSATGKLRRCVVHGAGSGVNWRIRQSQASALGREMKNFPMQESVGSTSARACRMALKIYRSLGMRARVMACLYDSMITLCPLEERELASKVHELVMSKLNAWEYDDQYGKRTLRYEIETDLNKAWSAKPSKANKALFEDFAQHPLPERLRPWVRGERLAALVA